LLSAITSLKIKKKEVSISIINIKA
jgi:hypothetical protein